MANDDFVNLHVHSHFSTLDGLSTPQEIVNRAADLGQRAIAVTDHGSMSGIPQMYSAAQQADIGFVPGCEMYFSTDRFYKGTDRLGEKYYHLILLATNNQGYKNLSKLQTIAWEDGYYYKPRCDYESLERYNEGLIVTTSCLGGIVNQHLLRGDVKAAEEELGIFVDIFGKERTYVELQNHGIDEQLKILGDQRDLANKFGLKMIATTDSHYCVHHEADAHDSLLCTGTKATKDQTNRFRFASDKHYIHSAEEMLELFPPREFPGAVSNTVEIAEQTDFTMNMGENKKYLMPLTGTPGGKTDDEVLRDKVYQGAAELSRYGDTNGEIPQEVSERIDYELSVIKQMRFSSYFLIVHNLIDLFARNGIHAGPGRGCVAPHTPVLTDTGWVSIEDIKPGDRVITAQGVPGEVVDTPRHTVGQDETLTRVVTDNGFITHLTDKHKVLTISDDNQVIWVQAADLNPGDRIAMPDNNMLLPTGKTDGTLTSQDTGINTDSMNTATVIDTTFTHSARGFVCDLTLSKDSHPSFVTPAGVMHNSAPGSVVVYCLGIVDVDPMEHGLFFERFLNPDRVSMPDIDVDIPRTQRQEALQLVEQEYGKGHVAHMSNYNKMGMRDAIVRAAKVYGMAPGQANTFRDIIATWCEDHGVPLSDFARKGVPPKDIASKLPHTDYYNEIVRTAAKFVGRMMGNGVHASGILITDTPLDDNFPIRLAKGSELPVCQYDGNDTESIGGVKFDLLGLINLDECNDTERNILLDLGQEVDSTNIPYDDQEVYEMLSHGHGGGVFQFGCLAGNTVIGNDGTDIETMYKLRNSGRAIQHTPSMFLGTGVIKDHKINQVVYSGVKETVLVETTHGTTLQCTPDHKLWTLRGWVKAGDLDPEQDYLLSWAGNTDDIGVRGRQDVVDSFLEANPTWMKRTRSRVMFGDTQLYPDVTSPCGDYYGYFYPDANHHAGTRLKKALEGYVDPEGTPYVTVLSYSEAMEQFCQDNPELQQELLPPVGCYWSKVENVTDAGETKTYDIMMQAPVHNFIANGIITHNSSGMQSLLRHMNPSEFKHIVASLALYRPGPMGAGTHDEYCERRLGRSPLDIMHDDMSEPLEDNYNLIIYQEDIMSIARLMAGYTGGEADDFRKAMAKKDPEMMDKHKAKFIPAINQRYGNNLGQRLWDVIEPFGSYAFNKCLAGTTHIILPEHGDVQVEDLYKEGDFYGKEILAMWEDGKTRPHKIKTITQSGRKPIYDVRTEKGRAIRITKDHRLLTTSGYGTIEDGSIAVGKKLVSDDNGDGSRGGASQFVEDLVDRELGYEPQGFGHRESASLFFAELIGPEYGPQVSGDLISSSMAEAKAAEYFNQRGVSFEMHKPLDSPARGMASFYADGVYFEMDGLRRGRQYFVDHKYGEDTPFVYITPEDYIEKIDEALTTYSVFDGDRIVEIISPEESGDYTEMTYDIEMMPDGPANFIANGLISHNSHSVAYGVLTYRTAWLKTHYPAQFAGAVMDHNLSSHDKTFETISWIKQSGVGVLPPSVQNSEMRSVTTTDSISLPLHIIRGVGGKKAEAIIDERTTNGPFTSVVDVVARCKLPKSMVVNMAKAGAFDSFGADRAAVIKNIDAIMSLSAAHESVMTMSSGLFGDMIESSYQGDDIDLSTPATTIIDDGEVIEVTDRVRSQWERDMMGVLVGKHPFESIRDSDSPKIKALLSQYPPVDVFTKPAPRGTKLVGMIHNISNRTSQRGKPYSIFNLETDRASVVSLAFDKEIPESLDGHLIAVEGEVVNDSSGYDDSEDGFTPKVMCSSMRVIRVENMVD